MKNLKKIQCDSCASVEFKIENNIYVCLYCGTKYTNNNDQKLIRMKEAQVQEISNDLQESAYKASVGLLLNNAMAFGGIFPFKLL